MVVVGVLVSCLFFWVVLVSFDGIRFGLRFGLGCCDCDFDWLCIGVGMV